MSEEKEQSQIAKDLDQQNKPLLEAEQQQQLAEKNNTNSSSAATENQTQQQQNITSSELQQKQSSLQNIEQQSIQELEQQQQQLSNNNIRETKTISEHILNLKETAIQDVWEHNFEEELWNIIELSAKYNMIAMDTEFPGVNKFPQCHHDDKDFEYQLIRDNVRTQKIIQIGISLADEQGNVPNGISTWQFNFKFDEHNDKIQDGARNLLKNAGIDFAKFKREGIDPKYFSEWFVGSDIVLNDDITWIAFHGGFDFGYFLQMLQGSLIPDQVDSFYTYLNIFFPKIYDIKYLIKDIPNLKDLGLQRIAIEMEVDRIGPQHQAGSDSLLTLATYFKLQNKYFKHDLTILEKGQNLIYGLGKGFMGEDHYNIVYRKMAQTENQQQYQEQYNTNNYAYQHAHQANFFQQQYYNNQNFDINQQLQQQQIYNNMQQQQQQYLQNPYWMQYQQQNLLQQQQQQQQQMAEEQLQQQQNSKDNYRGKR